MLIYVKHATFAMSCMSGIKADIHDINHSIECDIVAALRVKLNNI